MPTTLEYTEVFLGTVRNLGASINSISKVELNLFVGSQYNNIEYPPIEFEGMTMQTTTRLLSSANTHRVGIVTESLASFTFSGQLKKAESVVLLIEDLNISVVDSQDYVIVREEIQVNIPFWS